MRLDVKAPIYITAGWSALDAERHPEWWSRRPDGNYSPVEGFDPNAAPEQAKPEAAWMNLCLNDGSYAEHIYALTREICERYEQVDGLFYDICFFEESCYCDECRAGMQAMGFCPDNEADAKRYFVEKHNCFMEKCRAHRGADTPQRQRVFQRRRRNPQAGIPRESDAL